MNKLCYLSSKKLSGSFSLIFVCKHMTFICHMTWVAETWLQKIRAEIRLTCRKNMSCCFFCLCVWAPPSCSCICKTAFFTHTAYSSSHFVETCNSSKAWPVHSFYTLTHYYSHKSIHITSQLIIIHIECVLRSAPSPTWDNVLSMNLHQQQPYSLLPALHRLWLGKQVWLSHVMLFVVKFT